MTISIVGDSAPKIGEDGDNEPVSMEGYCGVCGGSGYAMGQCCWACGGGS